MGCNRCGRPTSRRLCRDCDREQRQEERVDIEYDGEEFCLSFECESMVVDAEQAEPRDFARQVLVPM